MVCVMTKIGTYMSRVMLAVAAVCILFPAAARGQFTSGDLLFRQAPDQAFALDSDTAFVRFGQQTSALTADNFMLSQNSPLCGVRFFGVYGADRVEPPPYIVDPPLTETMGVRVYSDAGGLPGSVLWEQTFSDAQRARSGRTVAVSPNRDEFVYTKTFFDCFAAAANTQYWANIYQVGDIGSRWRWEASYSDQSHAQQFPIGAPWHLTAGVGSYGMAFELHATPEPLAGVLLMIGLGVRRPAVRRRTQR
jgi:hypothetical protein